METQVGQIKQFLQTVYAMRRMFIVIASTVALAAVVASFFIPKVYEAKSTVFIERNVINALMQGITINPSMNDRIRVLRYHMLSRDMISRTLKRMDMDADKRYAGTKNFELLIKKCQEETNINVRGSDLFFVSIIDPDPSFAKEFINTLVNIYVEENLSEKREESYGANRFLSEQVTFYKKKLDDIDDKILNFRKETGIYSNINQISLMEQIASDEDALKLIKGQKAEIYATIKTIKQQLEMLKDAEDFGNDMGFDVGFGAGSGADPRIEQLQSKIDELLLVYNDQYPTVVKLREQIEELQKRQLGSQPTETLMAEPENYNPVENPIYVDLKLRLNATQAEFNALAAKQKDLMADVEANRILLRDFPQDKKRLNDMERERAMHLDVFNKLLQRVGVSEISKEMEVSDKSTTFRIVDPAILPTSPVGIKRILLLLVGILAGLAAGLASVFIAEKLDGSIRGTHIFRELGVTVLSEIPFIWSEAESRMTRKKDVAAFTFGAVCAVLVGIMLLHDVLGLSVIDQLINRFSSHMSL